MRHCPHVTGTAGRTPGVGEGYEGLHACVRWSWAENGCGQGAVAQLAWQSSCQSIAAQQYGPHRIRTNKHSFPAPIYHAGCAHYLRDSQARSPHIAPSSMLMPTILATRTRCGTGREKGCVRWIRWTGVLQQISCVWRVPMCSKGACLTPKLATQVLPPRRAWVLASVLQGQRRRGR